MAAWAAAETRPHRLILKTLAPRTRNYYRSQDAHVMVHACTQHARMLLYTRRHASTPLQADLSASRRSTLIWPWKWYLSCLKNASDVPFIGLRLTFGAFLTSPQHGVASALRSCSQLAQTCLCQPWLRMRSTPRRWHAVAQSIRMDTYTIKKANAGAQATILIF